MLEYIDKEGKTEFYAWELEPYDGPGEPMPEGIQVNIRRWYPRWLVAWITARAINPLLPPFNK